MWRLTEQDLLDLAVGAAFLGTGGGGDPYIGRLMVQAALDAGKTVDILDPTEVPDDVLVIPTAMMGAPTVLVEKIPSGDEAVASLRKAGVVSGAQGVRDHADRVRRDQFDDSLAGGGADRPAGDRRRRHGARVSRIADGDVQRDGRQRVADGCHQRIWRQRHHRGARRQIHGMAVARRRYPHGRGRLYRGIFDERGGRQTHVRAQHDFSGRAHRPLPARGQGQPRKPHRRAAAPAAADALFVRQSHLARQGRRRPARDQDGLGAGLGQDRRHGRLARRSWRFRFKTRT